jgi:aspartate/methionine/tyrosine aminotransferase
VGQPNTAYLAIVVGNAAQRWSPEPDGSCVAFVRYKGADGVETFTRQLVEEAGVLLLPSSVYRSELAPVPADRFRIGFGRASMATGLSVMRDWLTRRAS